MLSAGIFWLSAFSIVIADCLTKRFKMWNLLLVGWIKIYYRVKDCGSLFCRGLRLKTDAGHVLVLGLKATLLRLNL